MREREIFTASKCVEEPLFSHTFLLTISSYFAGLMLIKLISFTVFSVLLRKPQVFPSSSRNLNFFSRNTPPSIKQQISGQLQVTDCLGTGKYLGMPSMNGRKKKSIFSYLRDKIWRKIQQWLTPFKGW